MTPIDAHRNLINAIIDSKPMVGAYSFQGNDYTRFPARMEFIEETLQLVKKEADKVNEGHWIIGSPLLLELSNDWAERFGTVAKKLQEGQRFAPESIRSSKASNGLDPKLYNVLADGWHHTPIAEPLAPMPDDTF
jgi:hypothetical protein